MKEKVLSTNPGRDLDVWVALEVMDYIWATHLLKFSAELHVKWIATEQDLADSRGVYVRVKPDEWHALKLRENHDESVPAYSNDPALAENIVKKMSQKGFDYIEEYDNGAWKVSFSKDGNVWPVITEDKPEAVCKAALLAVLG